MTDRRRFRNTTDQVVDAVKACLKNATELSAAGREQLALGRPGLAVALSVLALEELGKLIITDGLAFAEPGDERAKAFESALRSHKSKLERLDMFPFAVPYFARFDKRYETDQRFVMAIRDGLAGTKSSREKLASWLGSNWSFTALDAWKQKGLYAHLSEGQRLVSPSDAIDIEFAKTLAQFAHVLINLVDFPLRNNFDRYRSLLGAVRSQWSEQAYVEQQVLIRSAIEEMFSGAAERPPVEH